MGGRRPAARRRAPRPQQDRRRPGLDAGTAESLRRYRKHFHANAEPVDLVFHNPQARPHTKFSAAELLRGHLRAIGLDTERPELFVSNQDRKQIRVHDLRGTFVTVSLANGKTEHWISDRTGHRSSAMIHLYKRMARMFEELDLGPLTPLVDALPEVKALSQPAASDQPLPVGGGPEGGPLAEKTPKKLGVPKGIRMRSRRVTQQDFSQKRLATEDGES